MSVETLKCFDASSPGYLIVGSGRVARHIISYFSHLNIGFLTWNRAAGSISQLQDSLKQCKKVLVLISDPEISPFIQNFLADFAGQIIHMSGSLEIPEAISVHPLMSFGPNLYELEVYKKMHFCLSSGDELKAIFPELDNPWFAISPQEKSLYHAWAVYAGNLPTLLWQESLHGLNQLGVPKAAITAYLHQILENNLGSQAEVGSATLPKVLTGPIARKDHVTIAKHLAVLPEPAKSIYQGFVSAYIPGTNLEVSHDAHS